MEGKRRHEVWVGDSRMALSLIKMRSRYVMLAVTPLEEAGRDLPLEAS